MINVSTELFITELLAGRKVIELIRKEIEGVVSTFAGLIHYRERFEGGHIRFTVDGKNCCWHVAICLEGGNTVTFYVEDETWLISSMEPMVLDERVAFVRQQLPIFIDWAAETFPELEGGLATYLEVARMRPLA